MIRKPALVLIFLANILLLASVIIPHHHHQLNVCFETRHCSEEPGSHQNNDHDHDEKNGLDCCQLKHDVVLPSADQDFRFVAVRDIHRCSSVFQVLDSDKISDLIHPLFSQKKFSDGIHWFDPVAITTSFGLRAPPSV